MGEFHDFDEVDAFTVGAVGRPGQRVFLLQARRGRQRVTVKCEKQQAAAIADYLRRVLNDLPPADDRPMPGALELAAPIEPTFVLGPIGLGYERSTDRVLIQLDELVPDDSDDEFDDEFGEEFGDGFGDSDDGFGDSDDDSGFDLDDDRNRLRVHLTRGQVLAFCEQADAVVSAGRPPCIWCARPIDPDGHICPRMN
jgi:uncharacterized repeat protein (TIGR03847 family)